MNHYKYILQGHWADTTPYLANPGSQEPKHFDTREDAEAFLAHLPRDVLTSGGWHPVPLLELEVESYIACAETVGVQLADLQQ